MRLFARFWPFGRPQSNPPAVGPQFHPLESNRNPSKMYSMFGAPFSQFSVFQLFPFSPLYLMFCGAYVSENFLAFAGIPQVSRKTFWRLRESRKHFQRHFGRYDMLSETCSMNKGTSFFLSNSHYLRWTSENSNAP